ncbi:MAG: transposase, partial [Methyloglobulus sp.]|nr:transposase [Methyloglobulus sp.]
MTAAALGVGDPWPELDSAFAKHYTQGQGRPSKPIRLMVGLLVLKQWDNLSDEQVVLHCKRNPYYQAFCGCTEASNKLPCDSTHRTRTKSTRCTNPPPIASARA